MVVLIAIAVLLSSNRRAINVRTVAGAFLIQISLGALVLFVPWGREGLLAASCPCLQPFLLVLALILIS